MFSTFRWQGWLDPKAPVGERITQALALADDFAAAPGRFADDELAARAIPSWVVGSFR